MDFHAVAEAFVDGDGELPQGLHRPTGVDRLSTTGTFAANGVVSLTVTVTRPDGGSDKYMRFGDACIKRNDGTLDVIRGGARQPYTYASGEWTDVEGDEKEWKKARFSR